MLPDGTEIMDGITAAGVLGLIIAFARLALGAHDKRATVAEEREKTCTTALTATTVATEALTTEVRTSGQNDKARLEALERGVAELLDHARRER